MATQRIARKERREEQLPPVNFTCGKCRQVHVYVSDKFECIYDVQEEEPVEVAAE